MAPLPGENGNAHSPSLRPQTGKNFGSLMNMKRPRGRNNFQGNNRSGGGGGGGGPPRQQGGNIPLNRNHTFDSSGPDMRVRGTAQQLFDKYLQLGRDATGAGDRVMAESYFQYAEHYFRILSAMNLAAQQGQGGQVNNNQTRRYQQDGDPDPEDGEAQTLPGYGEQPVAVETREIPIAAAPPVD